MEIKIVMKILLLAFMHQNEKENLFVVGACHSGVDTLFYAQCLFCCTMFNTHIKSYVKLIILSTIVLTMHCSVRSSEQMCIYIIDYSNLKVQRLFCGIS